MDSRKHRALNDSLHIVRMREGFDTLSLEFDLCGSQSILYTVRVNRSPSCTCPDFTGKRRACKHLIHCLHRHFNVPIDSDLIGKMRYTASELQQVFDSRFRITRKQLPQECAICLTVMTVSQDNARELTWCQTQCGHNFHNRCVALCVPKRINGTNTNADNKVAAAEPKLERQCPLCRSAWN